MKLSIVGLSFFLIGCSSTGVISTDAGQYLISKRSAQVGFGPPVGIKGDVYKEANVFCAKKNKSVKTIKLDETNSGFGKPAAVSLSFSCIE